MKKFFAIPLAGGKLTQHFGRCEQFAVVETEDGKILGTQILTPPEHQPGAYPRFLAERGVDIVLAGGMGPQAVNLFAQNGIQVYLGIQADKPERLVAAYLNNDLRPGLNQCDEHKN